MNPTRIIFVLLMLAAPGIIPAQDFSTFQVVSQRNIFNQNRVPVPSGPVRVVSVPRGTVDAFTLVGTLMCENGWFAFFDGTSPAYCKAATTNGTITGYKVAAILPSSVTLEVDGKQFEMKVGAQLRCQGGTAQLVVASASATTNAATAMTVTTSSGAAAGPGGDAADLLKKLMQKREQELK